MWPYVKCIDFSVRRWMNCVCQKLYGFCLCTLGDLNSPHIKTVLCIITKVLVLLLAFRRQVSSETLFFIILLYQEQSPWAYLLCAGWVTGRLFHFAVYFLGWLTGTLDPKAIHNMDEEELGKKNIWVLFSFQLFQKCTKLLRWHPWATGKDQGHQLKWTLGIVISILFYSWLSCLFLVSSHS